tara:strand:- start:1 stop:108 length:108 start_codon:yes stop_codon:yes gene_type:complete
MLMMSEATQPMNGSLLLKKKLENGEKIVELSFRID